MSQSVDLRLYFVTEGEVVADRPIKILCPFHSEDTPSCAVYADGAYCFGCKQSSSPSYLLRRFGVDREELDESRAHLSVRCRPVISNSNSSDTSESSTDSFLALVDIYAQQLSSLDKEEYFRNRGLFDSTIKTYKLGYTGRSYSIPIWNRNRIETIRYRRDDSISRFGSKYWGTRGHNQTFLFAPIGLRSSTILCEGELDCLLLIQLGFTAVSLTNGSGTDLKSLQNDSEFGKIKDLVIATDADGAGWSFALRTKKELSKSTNCRLIRLPKKDITECYLSHIDLGKLFCLKAQLSTENL